LVALLGVGAAILNEHHGLHIPILVHTLVGVALGLLLVFRTNASYDRWWEGRKLLGLLVNRTRDFNRQVVAYLDAPDLATEHATLQRWTDAFVRTGIQVLRRERDLDALGEVLLPEERARLADVEHRAICIQQWITNRLVELARQGRLTEERLRTIDGNLTVWSDALGACERIAKTPLPIAYAQHTKLLVSLFCFSAPFALAQSITWFTPVGAVALAFALFGVDEIGVEIEDPFGYDANDLPMDAIAATIARNTRELTGIGSASPRT
jgi:putative membrane protein